MESPKPGVTPFPQERVDALGRLSRSYLRETDPIKQSGFSGGATRWRQERESILEAVEADGSFLDIGCANGHLLECLGSWARERGISLELHGLEYSAELAELARSRIGDRATIHRGNAWEWQPPQRYSYVYSMNDVVPEDWLPVYIQRLAADFVGSGGRIILGSYGSRSRGQEPYDVGGALQRAGFAVAGTARGGQPPLTFFAWMDVG